MAEMAAQFFVVECGTLDGILLFNAVFPSNHWECRDKSYFRKADSLCYIFVAKTLPTVP